MHEIPTLHRVQGIINRKPMNVLVDSSKQLQNHGHSWKNISTGTKLDLIYCKHKNITHINMRIIQTSHGISLFSINCEMVKHACTHILKLE